MLDINKGKSADLPQPMLEALPLIIEATLPRDPREPVDFVSLECSSCEKAIQGSYFECVGDGCACIYTPGKSVFCETCSREPRSKHRPDALRKVHKRCVLSDCLSEEAARRACRCPGLGAPSKPDDTNGTNDATCSNSSLDSEHVQRPLFQFGAGDRHGHEQTCALARLRRRHERAKMTELQRLGMLEGTPESGGDARGPPGLAAARAAARAAVGAASRAGARAIKATDNIPYGNVHMSLMVGPLMIKNGVPQFVTPVVSPFIPFIPFLSKGGVLFSVRDRLQLHPVGTPASSVKECYALSGNKSSLWFAKEHLPRHRRVKALMKQIVGSPFWGVGGLSDTSIEDRVVKAVAEASLKYAENHRKSARFNEQRKASLRHKILRDIQSLLHARLKSYLRTIAGRLLDRDIPLAWHILDNNCQRFCDAVIDRRVFSSFMLYKRNDNCVTRWGIPPLYLVSFVSRIGCHDGFPKRIVPVSRAAAANGHTEEFLLRYRRFGHHNDTDIVDSLTEYWTDWGGFREPIFPHQGLFPWDCTEARTAEEEAEAPQVRCGDCSLAKHLWAFPLDAWSIVQLHLCRERRFYAPPFGDVAAAAAAAQLSLDEWRYNRLGVLGAMQALGVVAVAMRGSPVFKHACRWNFTPRGLVFPDDKGSRRARRLYLRKRGRLVVEQGRYRWEGGDGGVVVVDHDRVKLAGIHRAQPASHLYGHAMLHDCTLTDWADLAPADQVAAYVALRDARAVDVDGVIDKAAREGGRRRAQRPGGRG
ncbi:hypothetical protein RB595_010558 [Gaeumannomyces hyphopodioides]